MATDWASSDELFLALRAGRGRRAALEHGIRSAIRDGRLRPGDAVPSTRSLARDLGVARGTVEEAYSQLAAEGFLHTRPGSRARVSDAITGWATPGDPQPPAGPAWHFDLRVGVPDVGAFPRAAWIAAMRRALSAAPDATLTIGDRQGRSELRHALAVHVGRTRGVLANPAQIVICSGFAQGLAVLVKMLHDGGATEMAIEDPCAVHHRAIVRSNGLRIRPLAVDDGGAVSEPPKSAHAVLVTPAHQFPLGSTLEPKRRTALVRWAKDHEALVIEDDYDGEFRYDRQPVGALQGLDPDTVVYAGTASKTLVPGLRLGWLVLPQHLVAAAVNAKEVVGGEAGTLEQLTLAEFLRSGAYDRHVRRMRQRYRRRRDALLTTLNSSAPQLVPRGIAAGLHIVVEIPRGAGNERHLVQRAARRSLHIHALGPFWHDPPNAPQALVLGYGAPPEHAYAQTLDALAATLR